MHKHSIVLKFNITDLIIFDLSIGIKIHAFENTIHELVAI